MTAAPNRTGETSMSRAKRKTWVEQQLENDPTLARDVAEEDLLLAAVEVLGDAMAAKGWSRTDLARELGVSQSTVTKLFNAEGMTLRTLARAAHALGVQVRLVAAPLGAPGAIDEQAIADLRQISEAALQEAERNIEQAISGLVEKFENVTRGHRETVETLRKVSARLLESTAPPRGRGARSTRRRSRTARLPAGTDGA